MMIPPSIKEYQFKTPEEKNEYQLFPDDLENDNLVLFHGTKKSNFHSIIEKGFYACGDLSSVSYAYKSSSCLTHIANMLDQTDYESIVIAVRFETLDMKGIKRNPSDIHVYDVKIQPIIIGFCTIPISYKHT